ncbi:MAG: hypothetical protein OEM78_17750, partial [Gammaproteobacteria bacterium]|nr:hypothetical protein [Gammaproteobacteria bacterium]
MLNRVPIEFREPAEPQRNIEAWPIPARQKALTVLSNGHLSVTVTSDGGGGSEWNGNGVVRWQPQIDGSIGGSLLYFKNIDTGELRSIGAQTNRSEAPSPRFGPHIAEFTRHSKDLLTRLEIAVAPHVDLEIRRVSLTNESGKLLRMQIATYSEILLGKTRDYQRHPRFSKLFIESGYSAANDALLFRRRARSPDEHALHLAQAVVADPASDIRVYYETDRRRFLGRLRTTSDPAWFRGRQLESVEPFRYTLDPACTVSLMVEIQPNATFHCAFLTAVGDGQGPVLETLGHFRSLGRVTWAIEQARTRSERQLHDLDLSSEDVQSAFALLAKVTWTGEGDFQRPENLPATSAVQDYLWRHGISGDRPIVVARIENEDDLIMATRLVNAQRFWNSCGIVVDLLLMDDSRGGYYQPVSDRLQSIAEQRSLGTEFSPRGLLQILAGRHLDPIERQHLISSARVYLDRANGPYGEQLRALSERSKQLPPFIAQPSSPLTSSEIEVVARPKDLLFDNGIGGFSADGREYVIAVDQDLSTPSPWSNVLANPSFGALVTEAGGTFTWFKNSSEYRLTPWRNDPVTDGAGEGLYVRDEETGNVWSPCGGPRRNSSRYLVRHGPGYTRIEHNSDGLEQIVTQFVDPDYSVKFIHVRLRNRWPRVRRLTATYATEWVLGNDHIVARRLLVPEHAHES